MKPVYLEMNYFGPHEHSVIDFRQLETAPIFLIGGDTGAGKSTIFDAMTYALFGTTTNSGTEGRAANEMRSQFAPADQATTITFYFEQGHQLFKIIRQPDQWLAKQKGTGLTHKGSTAKFAIVDKVGGLEVTSIASKPSEVAAEVAQTLNLSADQFKKIILLPQNDFSEFLKSKTGDKEKILKKIFGTQLYSDFTQNLKDRYDAAKQTNDDFQAQLDVQLKAPTWTADEQAQLNQVPNPQLTTVTQQFVDQRQATLNQLEHRNATLETSLQAAENAYRQGRDVHQQFNQLADAQKQFEREITAKQAENSTKQTHLTALQWANQFKEAFRDYLNGRQEHQRLSQTDAQLQQTAAKTDQQLAEATAKREKLTSQAEAHQQQLERLTTLATLIPNVQAAEKLRTQVQQLAPVVAKLTAELATQKNTAQELADQVAQKEATLPVIADCQQHYDTLIEQRNTVVETLTGLLHQATQAKATMATVNSEYEQAEATLTTLQAQRHQAAQNYQQQRGRRQALMIAQLQQELVDGEPCVVCGSTDHSHMPTTITADEAELKRSMTAVDAAQDAYAAAQNAVKTQQQRLEQLQTQLQAAQTAADTAQTALTNQYDQLKAPLTLALPANFDFDTVKQVFATAIQTAKATLQNAQHQVEAFQQLQRQVTAQATQTNQAQLALAKKQTEQQNRQADLQAAEQKLPDVSLISTDLVTERDQLKVATQTYQQQLDQAQQAEHQAQLQRSEHQTQLRDIKAQLTTTQQKMDALQAELSAGLSAPTAPTNDSSVLRAWLAEIENGQLETLQNQITRYDQSKANLTATIQQLQQRLTTTTQPDLAALEATLQARQATKDQLLEQLTLAKNQLATATTSANAIQRILNEQGAFATHFQALTGLYQIVNGKAGNDQKLKLETFVVQNYLQRILNYANEHFINLLSNNRYTFELADQASDNRGDHGLDINVFDNETGEARSSSTLSGGETFIAALSIALSLSEVVQSSANGVQIDALFVDEGFGSLDNETLTKAMQALETIGENRMVGVISHIDSMKQTIGQQILIKKLGDGRSRVELISK
ncbi:AAA family ATPase [Lactiplantibacillus modestisalitolerans]|uniref:Nuclease SbcCD subunit C n=1 Tax=Lactiplantibacillus modestisalitolerans TaxID=1457219 RepID=A0ABV5WXT2_9LACO|nr:SMC family ATPase [Lactiplantibacillus modestisalitolerans]